MADPKSSVSVLIVDDQAPFRIAAAAVVNATPGFRVVGEAASGEEAVETVARLHPDLVLMDINMEQMNGIDATREIVQAQPGTVVMLLSTYQRRDLPAEALEVGAAAYVDKQDFGPDVLMKVWEGRDAP
ncbi:MAG: response regulator transcription factor [Actinomycetota bacterium]|nr:response regulator transcription factor [Actinomycetota bacterium]